MKRFVAYYRVSTDRQGRSGLGLDAQQAAVQQLATLQGAIIEAQFTEVESGRKSDRPKLAEALELCKKNGWTLVVAKLDRLARNVLFTAQLMESGIDFIACDMPTANRLTIHILAAVAEEEARMISKRTKDALAAAKARGVLLGSARPGHWEGREHLRGTGRKPTSPVSATLIAQMQQLRGEGRTFAAIADLVNAQGHQTPEGKQWTKALVHRLLSRHETVAA